MKHDDLSKLMRPFEDVYESMVPPRNFIVARLDGRSFTRLTKELQDFEAPFDERFRDLMVEAVRHLMEGGLRIVLGYTQSDEISVLFHRDMDTFGRRTSKLTSLLAAEASARFSIGLGDVATFDCRLLPLPDIDLVVDYFRWRQEDAHRNALNACAFWQLREEGRSAQEAAEHLSGMSVSDKNELLFEGGTNFNELPLWQRRGCGLFWEDYEKEGHNPKTGEKSIALRRRLHVDMELPMRDEFSALIRTTIERDAVPQD